MDNIKKLNIDCDDKELKAAIEKMERALPNQFKINALVARDMKSRYDEYVKAGFNPYQALELCKAAISA